MRCSKYFPNAEGLADIHEAFWRIFYHYRSIAILVFNTQIPSGFWKLGLSTNAFCNAWRPQQWIFWIYLWWRIKIGERSSYAENEWVSLGRMNLVALLRVIFSTRWSLSKVWSIRTQGSHFLERNCNGQSPLYRRALSFDLSNIDVKEHLTVCVVHHMSKLYSDKWIRHLIIGGRIRDHLFPLTILESCNMWIFYISDSISRVCTLWVILVLSSCTFSPPRWVFWTRIR